MITMNVEFRNFLLRNMESLLSVSKITDKVTVVLCKEGSDFSPRFFEWADNHDDFGLQIIVKDVYALVQK